MGDQLHSFKEIIWLSWSGQSKLMNQFCVFKGKKIPHIINLIIPQNFILPWFSPFLSTNIFKIHLDGKHGVSKHGVLNVEKQNSFTQGHHILIEELRHGRQDVENAPFR